VPCLGPRSTAVAGEGAQTLEGAAREWEKFRLELKRAIPGYRELGTGYAEERDRRD